MAAYKSLATKGRERWPDASDEAKSEWFALLSALEIGFNSFGESERLEAMAFYQIKATQKIAAPIDARVYVTEAGERLPNFTNE
jgi:hypothetical protein